MTIRRVSLDQAGQQFESQASLQDISDSGRHILFEASVYGPDNQTLLAYDFDTATGARHPIVIDLVPPFRSFGRDFLVADQDASTLAFDGWGRSFAPDGSTISDVLVFERSTGDAVRASEAADGSAADTSSASPLLTAGGNEVFFASAAGNLVHGDGNGVSDVFVRDLARGTLTALTLDRAPELEGIDFEPRAVSADASKLILVGENFEIGTGGTFILDRATGATTSLSSGGNPSSIFGDQADLSADGRLALVPGDNGGIELVDIASGARTVLADGFADGFVSSASMSADGRFVAFVTDQNGLVADDADGRADLFVRDHAADQTWRVNLDDRGELFSGFDGVEVETSPGGAFPIVAFDSNLPLTDDDTNDTSDVFAIEVDAIAAADRAVTSLDTPVRIDVLANDVDLDGVPATIAAVGPVANGTAVVEGGAIVFTPAPGFADSTSFSYILDDGEGNTSETTVRVSVAAEGPLTVTTADDVIADDGQLSLREAIEVANGREGVDRIGFAEALNGGTIALTQGQLVVTNELVIDGDTADGGPGRLILAAGRDQGDGDWIGAIIRVSGASLRIEDLSLTSNSYYSPGVGIAASNADVELVRGAVTDIGSYNSQGISIEDGHLLLQSSLLSRIFAGDSAEAISAYDADVRIIGSKVSNLGADYTNGIGLRGVSSSLYITDAEISSLRGDYTSGIDASGASSSVILTNVKITDMGDRNSSGIHVSGASSSLEVTDVEISGLEGGFGAHGIFSGGSATVTRSAVTGLLADSGSAIGIEARGSLTLTNSTIADVESYSSGGAVVLGHLATATISNTTIAGNLGIDPAFAGLVATQGAQVRLENSLLAGNAIVDDLYSGSSTSSSDLIGTILSNGHNLFGQSAVDGATIGDATGIGPREVFASLDDHGIPSPAYNGGPTRTVALLADPANPALDAAASDVAPRTDQRGVGRIGAPEIGAFELDQLHPSPPPIGATFLVTSIGDTTAANDGALTLREALALADADHLTADRIEFAPALQGQTIILGGSTLAVNSDVTIDGGGGVTIDAHGESRVLLVQGYGTDIVLQHMTITGGRTTVDFQAGRGGGIYADRYTTLAVEHSTVIGNSTAGAVAAGGGIYGHSVAMSDSTVTGNSTVGDFAAGGGIYGHDVRLTNSAIVGNSTSGSSAQGGGIYAYNSLALLDSKTTDNKTEGVYADGGGIYGRTVTLTNSVVGGNSTAGRTAQGGGISASEVTLTNSTVNGNRTTGTYAEGGGIYASSNLKSIASIVADNSTAGDEAPGGGISGSFLTLIDSTVDGNTTTGDNADGGGISGDSVTVTSTTVAANRTAGANAGGGGIDSGTLTLTNGTVSGNSTGGAYSAGGGVSVRDSDGIVARNSIIAGNSAGSGAAPDVAGVVSATNGRNIFGSEVEGSASGDLENVPASLLFAGGLADNGGLTPTIALRDAADNPALGRADEGTGPATDQRGEARPAPEGTNPDVGAFELDQSNPKPPPVGETFTVTTAGDVSADDGVLTLREALALANADSLTSDRIEFAPTMQGQTIVLGGSELMISSDVTVDGGAGITIDAAQASRVLMVQGLLEIDVVLRHLTISGGRTTGDYRAGHGGGIYAHRYTALTLEHSTVSGNSTAGTNARGGGIHGFDVTLTDSTVSGNSTTGENASGGGIEGSYGGMVTLTNSTVSGNISMQSGGGIHGFDMTLIDSTVSGNSTTGSAGGIYGRYMTLTNSAVTGNSTVGDYANSGGIYGRYLTLTNSTVSGNSAEGNRARGGGIQSNDLTLINSTVTGNTTAGAQSDGGGIAIFSNNTATMVNSIVAGNANNASTSPDVFGAITASNGHNIFGSDVVGNAPGDLENVPTALLFAGGLADNGGPTPTIALRDSADNPALGGAGPADTPATDQRGVARPQPVGTNPDIGAFELGASPPVTVIDGTPGDDALRGSAGAELIRGRAGSDRLWGLAGDDELYGGFGSDVLLGGPGVNRMTGGGGADRFVLRQPETAPPDGPAYDEILDFTRSQQDRIDLQPIDARSGAAGNQAFRFIDTDAFTRAGQLRYEATADGDFLVSGNVDRDLAADFAFIVRSGVAILRASDFLL